MNKKSPLKKEGDNKNKAVDSILYDPSMKVHFNAKQIKNFLRTRRVGVSLSPYTICSFLLSYFPSKLNFLELIISNSFINLVNSINLIT